MLAVPMEHKPVDHSSWRDWLTESDRISVEEVLSILGTEGASLVPERLPYLFPRLSMLARHVAEIGVANSLPWLRWSKSLESANSILDERGIKKAPLNNWGNNPFLVGASPLSACLTQSLDPKLKKQYLVVAALLLAVLATDTSGSKKKFHAIADTLRNSRHTSYSSGRLLSQLPAGAQNDSDFPMQVESSLARLKATPDAQTANGKRFVNAITKLLRHLESIDSASAGDGDKPGNKRKRRRGQPVPLRLPVDEPVDGVRWRPPGMIAEVDVTYPGEDDEPGLPTTPESPLLTYTENLDVELDEPTEAISEEGVAARARQTRYWLSRFYSITPVDRALLTPLERGRLVVELRAAMAISAALDEGFVACVLALSYFLGLEVQEILALEFSRKGDLDPFAGIYKKPLLRPENSYVPEEDDFQYYEETPSNIELVLPKFVTNYLTRLDQKRKAPSRTSFGSVIGLDPDVCLEEAKRFLEPVREQGRYQIYIERIRASLRNDLSAHCRNPVITYLLAGTADQQAPMLAYYQGIRVDYLKKAYEEACQRLLAEEYQVF